LYNVSVPPKLSRALVKHTNIDDGSMSQNERQKVVDKIKTDKETRIILMSFKAGGVGKLLRCGVPNAGS